MTHSSKYAFHTHLATEMQQNDPNMPAAAIELVAIAIDTLYMASLVNLKALIEIEQKLSVIGGFAALEEMRATNPRVDHIINEYNEVVERRRQFDLGYKRLVAAAMACDYREFIMAAISMPPAV